MGTLLRSAAAFGFDGVLLGPGCAAPFAPKTLRASMGAAGRLPVLVVSDLPAALTALRGRGVTCLAAALYHSRPLDEVGTDFPGGVCLVIGSEGQGLTDAAVAFGQVEVLSEDGETAFLTDRISGQDAMQQAKFLNVLASMRVLS